MAGEIQIEMLAHQAIRNAGEAIQRILDAVAKELSPQHVVIQWNSQRKFHRRSRAAVPEVQVIFPAGVEEFPLQVRHFNKLGARLLLHPCMFERDEERRHKRAFRIAKIVEQVQ